MSYTIEELEAMLDGVTDDEWQVTPGCLSIVDAQGWCVALVGAPIDDKEYEDAARRAELLAIAPKLARELIEARRENVNLRA